MAPTKVASGPPGLAFLNDATLAALFAFPADTTRVEAEVNRLDNQVLVHTYEREWRTWN